MENINDLCIQTLCRTPSLCAKQYYKEAEFLKEQSLWSFTYLYVSLITMLFTHDPWQSIGSMAVFLMVRELWTAVSVRNDYFYVPGGFWDPGDVASGFFYALCGISIAMAFIAIFESPRFIRSPYSEFGRFVKEYGDSLSSDQLKRGIVKFKESDYRYYRWKYYLQLAWIQAMCYVCVVIPLPGPERGVHFRMDWMVLTIYNCATILGYFFTNWNGQLEREIIWRNNRRRYVRFHIVWFCLVVSLSVPGIYAGFPSKIETLIGTLVSYALFMALWLTGRILKKVRHSY